ncbi:sensor histidine kinase [Shimia biformata]|uniref:sensor histidine kinase n=1 Tax=Shimia biformata TaxID=1294299 RepID=UPI00194EC20A|nr:HAMP domain-containing sensor histidine kinase [Shimia biformata]
MPNAPDFAIGPKAALRHIVGKLRSSHKLTGADVKRLEKQIKDFAGGGLALFWQRQGIYFGAALLCAFFYSPDIALFCFALCQGTEMLDTFVSMRAFRWNGGSARKARMFHRQLLATSTLSSIAVGSFTLMVANLEGPAEHFTSLFFLFAAGLFAAVNNHQLPSVLGVRLVIYGAVFLFIPLRDIWVEQPPIRSAMWVHFLTVLFVLYFVLECSMIFLRLYRNGIEQYEELRIERDRAKEVYELKSQFVSVVSHELRTPLTSIIGALGLMKSMDTTANPEGYQKILGIADKNSKRLSNLINDLLDLQKLESEQMNYNFVSLDPAEVVEDSVDAIASFSQKENKDVKVVTGRMDRGHLVRGDYDRMLQVFDNLLSNAVKFSSDGSSVTVEVCNIGDAIRISVTDTGIGIPEGSKDKIFAKFSQIDSTDHRAHEGTGLGLNIVQQIVHAHAAEIDYESELGKGTTFFVTMPLAEQTEVDHG